MSCDAVARVLAGYRSAAPGLIARFEALSSSQVLAPVADLLPPPPGPALDIGAGTGRDAAWLARQGYRTRAVEPVAALRAAGQARHGEIIDWCDDRLPDLPVLRGARARYQLVLANGVLHHLPPAGQITAIDSMACLLAPGGAGGSVAAPWTHPAGPARVRHRHGRSGQTRGTAWPHHPALPHRVGLGPTGKPRRRGQKGLAVSFSGMIICAMPAKIR